MNDRTDQSNSHGSGLARPDGSAQRAEKTRIDWADPTVPIGNAPPLARWPLIVTGIAWLVSIGFLIAMTLSRLHNAAR